MTAHPAPEVSPELLARYSIAAPRYTSYPTADRFHTDFGQAAYQQALTHLQNTQKTEDVKKLAVYVHIPFCTSLCYFCACNKIITKNKALGDEYLAVLQQELDVHRPFVADYRISQLHLGGGSPTFLDDAQLAHLMDMLAQFMPLHANSECAIEVDPRTVTPSRLKNLATLGFNRISFGVQDFNHEVQQAINRIQATEQVFNMVQVARENRFNSINIDLIYGLPQQTPASFVETVTQVCTLRPDRIALYAYAHLPQRFKAQRRIDDFILPSAQDKLHMQAHAIQALVAAGYVYVGMDHFALPNDSLVVAKEQGYLQRNFQGYSSLPDYDLLGLGVSSISRLSNTYSQNAKRLEDYKQCITQGNFAVERGYVLSQDDRIRRALIMTIMCQGIVQFDAFSQTWDIDFVQYFAAELKNLEPLQQHGLVVLTDSTLQVSALGWHFVRAVAMVFDTYLKNKDSLATFSKII